MYKYLNQKVVTNHQSLDSASCSEEASSEICLAAASTSAPCLLSKSFCDQTGDDGPLLDTKDGGPL